MNSQVVLSSLPPDIKSSLNELVVSVYYGSRRILKLYNLVGNVLPECFVHAMFRRQVLPYPHQNISSFFYSH